MFPYFILFGRMISMYMIMAVIGMIIAGFFFCRRIKKAGLDSTDAIIVLLISSLGIFAGGHILYGITNIGQLSMLADVHSFSELLTVLSTVFGGAVFYGGLFGGVLAGLICIKVMKLDMAVYTDAAAPTVPLFHAFARIGCFLGGCCYGIESDFGFTAHGNTLVDSVNDISRFPVQLFESLMNVLLFLLLWYLLCKKKLPGRLFLLYLLLYSFIRFGDEFLRGDAIRGFIFGISTSQFISILIAATVIAVFALDVIRRRHANSLQSTKKL